MLTDTYTGDFPDNVLYADITPSLKRRLSAQFKDCKVQVKDLRISDSYEGILEGDPNFIAERVLERAMEKASKDKLISHKVIFPKWQRDSRWPLPPCHYEMTIQHYEQIEHPEYYGQSDWYFLKLVWFDNAPAENQTLEEYVNSITSQLEFFTITRKLTEDEKEYWC